MKKTTSLAFTVYILCASNPFLMCMENKTKYQIVNTPHNHPYDLFHWQTKPDQYSTDRFDLSYGAAGNVTRIWGAITGFFVASAFMPNSFGRAELLLTGKVISALLTTSLGLGLIYDRRQDLLGLPSVVKPKTNSYYASYRYGIREYFLFPGIVAFAVAHVIFQKWPLLILNPL